MHRVLLREIVIDAPTETFGATRDFWAAALLATPRHVADHPEFTGLSKPASLCRVGLQDVGDAPARLHLDIETDDVEAEVARLTDLGARVVAQGRTWVVMRDPSGLVFDVVPAESPSFEQHAREVS